MMERPLADSRKGDVGLNCAAHAYNIPKATLKGDLIALTVTQ